MNISKRKASGLILALVLMSALFVVGAMQVSQGPVVIQDGGTGVTQASVKAAGVVTPNVIGVQGNASGIPIPVITSGAGSTTYVGTGSTIVTLSTTSGTVATASTINVNQLSCYNSSTTTQDSFSRTDTAGNTFEVQLGIPAKSNYLRSYGQPGEKMVGLKWWSANGTLNCDFTATQ